MNYQHLPYKITWCFFWESVNVDKSLFLTGSIFPKFPKFKGEKVKDRKKKGSVSMGEMFCFVKFTKLPGGGGTFSSRAIFFI